MVPPPAPERNPRSLSGAFEGSVDSGSGYTDSVVVEATGASEGTGSRPVNSKRERDGASKADEADETSMEEEDGPLKGDSSTGGMDQATGSTEGDEDDEEEQGQKRA